MRVLPFTVIKAQKESFKVQVDDGAHLYDTLHQHSDWQLTLIVKSKGTIICGNHIGHFQPGDLYLIGSNQPHVFRNDPEYFEMRRSLKAKAISVYFDQDAFGEHFFDLPETAELGVFLQKSTYGLKITGTVRDKLQPMMEEFPFLNGVDKLMQLLQALKLLSLYADCCRSLSSSEVTGNFSETEGKRMNAVIQFTLQKYRHPISLEEVAGVAHMTPNAFCRYFKQRTRKSYVTFLNEFRIGHACKMLLQKDMSIKEACYQSGFNNISNFNRKFKEVTGSSPTEYLRNMANNPASVIESAVK
jgi:AraC-like DNA-binding protein